MKGEEYVFDLLKMFHGGFNPLVFLEILIRVLIMYPYILFIARMLGKRVKGQISAPELIIVVLIGASSGTFMVNVRMPLLHGMFVLLLILGLERTVAMMIKNSRKFYSRVVGEPLLVVRDGKIVIGTLDKAIVAKEELMSLIRLQGLEQLGQIKEAYLEPTGQLCLFQYEEPEAREGLSTKPFHQDNFEATEVVKESRKYVCGNCGQVEEKEEGKMFGICRECNGDVWHKSRAEGINRE